MRLLLVCDGPGDVDGLKALTYRILCGKYDWLDGVPVEWVEYEPGQSFLDLHDVHAVANRLNVPMPKGPGLGFGGAGAKRAFLLGKRLAIRDREPLGIVFVWDVDDQRERDPAVKAARDSTEIDVALGMALPEYEAWCICAFAPETAEERAAHDAVKRDLGFDPLTRSHELSHKKASVTKKDTKSILENLCVAGRERDHHLVSAPLDHLCERGEKNGLREFHDEVQTRLAPLFGARKAL